MKKIILLLVLFSCFGLMSAQTDSVPAKKVWPSFLSKSTLPDGTNYLPVPPAFDSDLFAADILWYHWGRQQRATPRAQQARLEADLGLSTLLHVFIEPLGLPLTETTAPELCQLVSKTVTDACSSTSKAKKHYNRLRPFLYFNEGTLIPEEEESHHTPSYPSSHSASGWAVALVLTELLPDHAEALLKAGYEYGQSRVIAGYHYQSDVEAGRLAAAACVARLHADKAFQKQLKKSRKEIARLLRTVKP